MWNKIPVNCRLWPYFLSILIIAVMLISLFGGLKLLLSYKKIVQPDLVVDAPMLRYFTKEFLQRRVQKTLAPVLPVDTKIPSFWIYTDEADFQSLESDLPASSKEQNISGFLKIDKSATQSEIKLNFRGGLALHWLYEKKSFRIKMPDYKTYLDEQKFNLVNIATPSVIIDVVSYAMAEDIGLLSPEFFPARVYINNNYNGLHFFLSGINESLLRKRHKMPGSIYSGDTFNIVNPFGGAKDKLNELMYFKKNEKNNMISLLWSDSRLWKKNAGRNAETKDERLDIQKFIELSNQSDPISFMKGFNHYFDKKQFFLFWALDTITASHHHDLFHNHKIYFDPYKGKFEPIAWDLRFWNGRFPVKDIIENPLLEKVKLNPILELSRDKVIFKLLQKFSVDVVMKKIDAAIHTIKDELESDPYRQAPITINNFKADKAVPFSIHAFEKNVALLKEKYKQRHLFLTKLYNSSQAEFKIIKKNKNNIIIRFSINGNNPIIFSPLTLFSKDTHPNISIFRYFDGKKLNISFYKNEILYPGKKIVNGNHANSEEVKTIIKLGDQRIISSPLFYDFVIQGDLSEDLLNLKIIEAKNAITGKNITINSVLNLPDSSDTSSIHPWKLNQFIDMETEKINLSGVINVSTDTIYEHHQLVTIMPGTIFNMAKDTSIIFYGQVIVEGTIKKPIIFKTMHEGDNWGSLIVQGQAASGSTFNHIHISGGSLSKHWLISYPGQFNIHDVASFEIKNCWISDNKVGDDALHIAYSKGSISNCHFENTAFDALDIDISDVLIKESEFRNIGNDAIDLMTSNITMEHITVSGAMDKCISIGEESKVIINNGYFDQCHIGLAVKDKSEAFIHEVQFNTFKDSAISLFRKNPRYSKGGVISGNNIYGINENDIKVGPYSVNKLSF